VSWDHERVQELLAGRALGGLDPEDLALADRAVAEHVSGCDECRAAEEGFRAAAGDLALLAPPAATSAILDARLSRLTGRRTRPRLSLGWTAAAAATLALVGMAGWTIALDRRLDRTQLQQAWMVDALSTIGQPDVAVVPLQGSGRAAILQAKGGDDHYLLAAGLPEPRGVYQVWFLGEGQRWTAGAFVPDRGTVMVPLHTDMSQWHTVVIVDAPDEDTPAPTASPLARALLDAS
jgi:hypothetical protein